MYDREKLKREVLLYAVTDSRWCQGTRLEEQIEKALKGGISFLQLREKELSQKEFIEEGKRVLNLCRQYKVPLVIKAAHNKSGECMSNAKNQKWVYLAAVLLVGAGVGYLLFSRLIVYR